MTMERGFTAISTLSPPTVQQDIYLALLREDLTFLYDRYIRGILQSDTSHSFLDILRKSFFDLFKRF